jgi:hypothetical protein
MRLRDLIVAGLALALPARAGEISGTVRLAGRPPPIAFREVAHDTDVCGERPRPLRVLVLGADQAVRGAIVYLGATDRGVPDRPTGSVPAVLDQRDCEFAPRVQMARSGAPLIVRNSDPTLHIVRVDSMSGTNAQKTLLTVATPYAGFEKKYQLANFREPTLLRATNLNGHDWMTAYIAVMPHPWAALTDAGGRYVLRDVPSGAYKLYAWHEALGTLTRDVQVANGQPVTLDLEFRAARAPRSSVAGGR